MFDIISGRLAFLRLTMLLSAITLMGIGMLCIYAAQPEENFWIKQLVYIIIGLVGFLSVNSLHYRLLGPLSYWLYGIIIILLGVLLLGKFLPMPEFWRSIVPVINGSRRWIRIAGIQVQPSEFCKIAYILSLSWYLRYRSNYRTLKGLIGPFGLTLLAMMLIILEPDLGTVLLMMPILFATLFAAGAKKWHLITIILLGVLASPLLWMNMHAYQRMRIASVLLQNDKIYNAAKNNEKLAEALAGSSANLIRWKRDKGYHLMHSKQAIASGGVFGYGFGKGPYLSGDSLHLPEAHNDFIFALIAHQWGLVGCLFVFFLYCIIAACGLEIAWNNTDPYGRLIAIGIVAMLMVQVVVNTSMTMGLMPITGLTLPLVSYGGSSLIVNMIAVGLLNNIGRDRPFIIGMPSFEFDGKK
ncbi:MAG: FtsW/RodA/SpoVE family cell cycle protein [Sedimentisphaeraceae bacterium JB056]